MCLSITDLQYSRHKFCSECGKSKEEAQETCEGLRKEIKKGLREKKEIENCPGKGKWIDSLVVAWAQYKISKEDGSRLLANLSGAHHGDKIHCG